MNITLGYVEYFGMLHGDRYEVVYPYFMELCQRMNNVSCTSLSIEEMDFTKMEAMLRTESEIDMIVMSTVPSSSMLEYITYACPYDVYQSVILSADPATLKWTSFNIFNCNWEVFLMVFGFYLTITYLISLSNRLFWRKDISFNDYFFKILLGTFGFLFLRSIPSIGSSSKSSSAKMFYSSWLIGVFFTIACLTTTMTSSLVRLDYDTIDDAQDMLKKPDTRLLIINHTDILDELRTAKDPTLQKLWLQVLATNGIMDTEEFLNYSTIDCVLKKGCVIYSPVPAALNGLMLLYPDEFPEKFYLSNTLKKDGIGCMPFAGKLPLRVLETFTSGVERIFETKAFGHLDLKDDYRWGRNYSWMRPQDVVEDISMDSIYPGFAISGILYSFVVLVFVLEIAVARYDQK